MVSVPRPRAGTAARRVLRLAYKTVRRFGLLPPGIPDRYGDDDRLAGSSFPQTVLVYFADTRESLYQLREWYGPLRALDDRHPVVLVFQDSRTAAIVRQELSLPAHTIARYSALDALLARSEVKLALYVNHNPQNFSALRFTSLAHVYLGHGESDKGVMVSNQCKAYDFWFVAGKAAIDRITAYTMFYDAEHRCVPIGRPQLDFDRPVGASTTPLPTDGRPGDRTGAGRQTVLYAPTWEGAQPSLAYGSLPTHGVALVRALLASGRFDVAYRPHPLTGVTATEHGDADATVRDMIAKAATTDPAAAHRVDVDRTLYEVMADADLLVCDVSAVAIDWLPSGRPMVVTEPASPDVVTAKTPLLDIVPRLTASASADERGVVSLLSEQLEEDPTKRQRADLVDLYFGDTSPGSATRRFLDACTATIAWRDAEWARVRANGPAGP